MSLFTTFCQVFFGIVWELFTRNCFPVLMLTNRFLSVVLSHTFMGPLILLMCVSVCVYIFKLNTETNLEIKSLNKPLDRKHFVNGAALLGDGDSVVTEFPRLCHYKRQRLQSPQEKGRGQHL